MEIHRLYTSRILKMSRHASRILIEERTQVNIWNKEDNWTRQALVPNMEVGKYVEFPTYGQQPYQRQQKVKPSTPSFMEYEHPSNYIHH